MATLEKQPGPSFFLCRFAPTASVLSSSGGLSALEASSSPRKSGSLLNFLSLRSTPLKSVANLRLSCAWNGGLAAQVGLARFYLVEKSLNYLIASALRRPRREKWHKTTKSPISGYTSLPASFYSGFL
jgi:hypothetical protein